MPEHKKGESRDDWMKRCIPDLIKNENKTQEQAAGQCGGMYDSWKKQGNFFEPPESGDAPQGVKNILSATYNNCRQRWVDEHPKDRENQANKESCARIAWNAVKNAGWRNVDGKWTKSGKMSESETYDLPDIEIFAAGTWKDSNGKLHEFTKKDLYRIVETFNELKGQADPPLKLGHSIDQKLLKSGGLPSAGWLDNLRVKKDKIIADFKRIPKEIFKIIRNGGLKRVSPEIVYDYQAQPKGKIHKMFLEAVALLGIEQKAMKSLKDFVSVYSEGNINDITLELDLEEAVFTEGETYEENNNNNKEEVCLEMDAEKLLERKETEINELKGKFSESESKVKTLSNDLNEANEKIETLEAENKELKEKVTNFAEEAKKKELESYIDSQIAEGKIPASVKDKYIATFSDLPEDKLKEIKDIIESTPKIDFSEHSVDTTDSDKPDGTETDDGGDEKDPEGEKIDKKIKAEMSEAKVDYLTAEANLKERGEI